MASSSVHLAETDIPVPANSLFGLPRELRDQIFRLAFVQNEEGVSKIIAIEKWLDDERERRRRHALRRTSTIIPTPPPFVPRPMPTCPLYAMIVNKQFFDEAATAYLRYQTLKCDDMWTFNKFCNTSKPLKAHITKFVCRWNKRAEPKGMDSWSFFCGLRKCASLRELRMTVHDKVFDILQNRLVCAESLTAADFREIQEVYDLISMPSLQRVSLTAEPSGLAATEEEQTQWRENVAAMEQFLNKSLKKLREIAQAQEAEGHALVFRPIPGFEDMNICFTNYHGEDRTRVMSLIRACGAEWSPALSKSCTHLITSEPVGEKYEAAQDWHICTVNHHWLEDSFNEFVVKSTACPVYAAHEATTGPRPLTDFKSRCEPDRPGKNETDSSVEGFKSKVRRFLTRRYRPSNSSKSGKGSLDTHRTTSGKLRQTTLTTTPLGLASKPTGISKSNRKGRRPSLEGDFLDFVHHSPEDCLRVVSRSHTTMTAFIAFAVSSVNTYVLWKLLSGRAESN